MAKRKTPAIGLDYAFDLFAVSKQSEGRVMNLYSKEEETAQQPTVVATKSTISVGIKLEIKGRTYEVIKTSDEKSVIKDITYMSLLGIAPCQTVKNTFLLSYINDKAIETQTQPEPKPRQKSEEIKKPPRKKRNIANQGDSVMNLFDLLNNADPAPEPKASEPAVAISTEIITESIPVVPTESAAKPDSIEVPSVPAEKIDYIIKGNDDYRTKGERIVANIEAITLLKKLQEENRNATEKEQAVLNCFTGWGGLQDVFDESKRNEHYSELRELLTVEEYCDARRSILDAFYTPYPVIKSIYKCLKKAGFKGGRVLEPSCGTGRFFGLMPNEIRENSSLYGVELDTLTAAITEQLYQNLHICNCGFEDVNYGNNVFDLAITNVPYGETSVSDSVYNRYNFKIHDYFISKMIDVVRPGGIVVAITSSFSMDKNDKKAREYWAKRAELVGAYRLPNSTFGNAHTDVVADVLIFKKRTEEIEDISEIEWLDNKTLTVDETDTNINLYFINHRECIGGDFKVVSGPFGNRVTVQGNLEDLRVLEDAKFDYEPVIASENSVVEVLPEELMNEPDYCYCLYNNKIVYKENGIITYVPYKNKTDDTRKRELISLRKAVQNLIKAMVLDADPVSIRTLQTELNKKYDKFVYQDKLGYISSRSNSLAFRKDAKYPLLCSLEIFNDEGEFIRKADIFTQRTIKKLTSPHADNEEDALEISLAEKGCVDFDYMQSLTGLNKDELIDKLKLRGRLFKLPFTEDSYEPSETYLSGYVKKKLKDAVLAAQKDESFKANVEALEAVQPKDIPFYEIYCPLGATWVPVEIYQAFMEETFEINNKSYYKPTISVVNHQYYINRKDLYNVKTSSTYGTSDFLGLRLFEDCLNLVQKKVYDYVTDEKGVEHAVLNAEKTQICQNKQEFIKSAWSEWIEKKIEHRNTLERIYNDSQNDLVQPEYDGSKLSFPGMSSNIELMPHQKNAALRIIRTGNTLLAHVVGAGKTFTMAAAAMERKRLGLSNKPCFVVPNHLVEQWAGEINRLYPFANVLITKKDDFKTSNRKRFCAKVATGNWDAVVMSHSQFSRIPLSKERQEFEINRELYEIEEMLDEINDSNADYQTKKYTRYQYEAAKRKLNEQLKRLMDSKKDDTVCFEELGIDLLFLDEAHLFKNLQVYTKLQNVAGLTNAVSKKATDLLMKIHYLNDITDYQGVVFATGTPISNAVCELYVMQKYLQEKDLHAHNIFTFDSWISHFSETENKIEVKPEGTGYRTVTRVSKYHNLPELMNIFRLVADIRVASQLELDVPERRDHNIAVLPSETQTAIVQSFADRAEKIRSGAVDSSEDNMLCVTNDGRKVAIDQRLYDTLLPDDLKSKLNRCTRTVYKIWKISQESKATQLVFCDMGTPKKNPDSKIFDVYNDIKSKLLSMGVPESQIAFIHDANTDDKKAKLFEKVNRGEVRILLGSTEKLGAGTNVQKRLLAIHNIDCPWRPADLEQRAGRIVRQGNMHKKVYVYTYVTKNTFDTYLYQTVLAKAEFIAQIMSAKTVSRDMDDIDSACLNYAEIKALSTGNPAIKEKMELEEKVAKLKVLRSNYFAQKYELEVNLNVKLPNEIKVTKARIYAVEQDIDIVKQNPLDEEHHFSPMVIDNVTFSVEEKKEAAEMLLHKITSEHDIATRKIASYRGFDICAKYNIQGSYEIIHLYSPKSDYLYRIRLGDNAMGNIQRLNNALDSLASQKQELVAHLEDVEKNIETAKIQLEKPFDKEAEYKEAVSRLRELNAKLAAEGANGIENLVD